MDMSNATKTLDLDCLKCRNTTIKIPYEQLFKSDDRINFDALGICLDCRITYKVKELLNV